MTTETGWTEIDKLKGHGIVSKINTSGLKPCGHAVLVEPYEPEKSKSVIVLPPDVSDRQRMINDRDIFCKITGEK
jgi:hypothetical protein